MLYYGVWGGILGHNVDIRVGHVVCRQLGYSRAERIFSYSSFGGGIGPLWIRRIQCNGNETEISQCKVETWDKIWNTSSYHWYDFFQRPRNAASLLCNKANSSLGRYNLQRSCPSYYMRHKLHSEVNGQFFFTSFFVVVFGQLFAADRCVYLFSAGHVFFYSQHTKAGVFILFTSIINFVFIVYFFPASPMGFTCLRSGLSFFASIKICFFSFGGVGGVSASVSLLLVFQCLGNYGSSVWPPDFPIPYNERVGRSILCK